MTLTQLEYFEAVCEYKNITKAAKALFVSRSAISRSLKELENEWNVTLFTRSRNGVELTQAGQMIRDLFDEFNKSYNSLKRYINETKRLTKTSELRIGITSTTGSRFFPDFFPGFKNKYPDIHLRIFERPPSEHMNAITNGDCDFFITPYLDIDLKKSESIGKIPVYKSEMVFCVSSDHELAKYEKIRAKDISEIDRASLLIPISIDIFDETFIYGSFLDCCEDSQTVIQTSQQELIHKAVACGFATTILPREIVENWEGVSMIPFDPVSEITVHIIWDKNLPHSEAFDQFLHYIQEYDFSKLT